MIKLFIITLMTIGTTQAACNIELLVKKQGAKTYYTSLGSRMSKSNVEAIKGVCKITVKLMSHDQVTSIYIKRLEKRLAKLKGGK